MDDRSTSSGRSLPRVAGHETRLNRRWVQPAQEPLVHWDDEQDGSLHRVSAAEVKWIMWAGCSSGPEVTRRSGRPTMLLFPSDPLLPVSRGTGASVPFL